MADEIANTGAVDDNVAERVGPSSRFPSKASSKERESTADDYRAAKAAQATLRARPSDPAANLAFGRFLCFVKDDWGQGLQKLALGNDPALKQLAERELATPADAAAQAKLGDGWWELAESVGPIAKRHIQQHAALWYQKARSKLTGLTKVRVEKRIDEWKQAVAAARGNTLRGSDTYGFNYLRLEVLRSGAAVEINDLAVANLDTKKLIYMNDFNSGNLDALALSSSKDTNKNVWAFDRTKTGIANLRLQLIAPRSGEDGVKTSRTASRMVMTQRLPKNFSVSFVVIKLRTTGDFTFSIAPGQSNEAKPIFKTTIEGSTVNYARIYVPREKRQRVKKALAAYRELPISLEPDGSKIVYNAKRRVWK